MITLEASLWQWSGGSSSWYFITVQEELAKEIRAQSCVQRGAFGSVRVEATINDIAWRTSVFPQKSGGYILPVKAEVRRRANITVGDDVIVRLELL